MCITKRALSCLVAVLLIADGSNASNTPSAQAPAITTIYDGLVELGAYIESLCPDSRRFFLNQLVPVNRELGELFNVSIVPFGHARVLGNNRMVCQHGQRECDGNRKMACVLARSANKTEAIETLGCMFESLDDWKNCVKKHMPREANNLDAIDLCSSNDESYQMMVEFEKLTGRTSYIPKLTLNGKHDADLQSEIEYNLKNMVCEQCKKEPKPAACKQTNDDGNSSTTTS